MFDDFGGVFKNADICHPINDYVLATHDKNPSPVMSKEKQHNFVMEQYAKLLNCSVYEVEDYIKSTGTKPFVDTSKAEFSFLRETDYYKCKPNERLLNAIRNEKKVE